MAQDIFLKITGIDGESQDASHKNEIEVTSWAWKVSQDSTMHSGSGGGSGKASVDDLAFEHALDRASPNLMQYLKITMSDVLVTKVHPQGSNSEKGIREHVRLSFSKVKQEYILQNAQGGSGGAVTAAFDIRANKVA
jgi:type VI secretion system secreted protein Hcp